MRPGMGRHSLGRRIVATVALGLAMILALFGVVALWTIQESTEAAYRERVALARALAQRVDDVLRYALVTLEREAGRLRVEPGRPLSQEQRESLADLRLRVGSFAIITVIDAEGLTVWTDPSHGQAVLGRPIDHPSAQLALHTGRPHIVEFQSPVTPEAVFACLAVPLRDADGRIAGALMAEVDPSHAALSLVPSGEASDSAHVQLVNAAGRLLAGTPELKPEVMAEHQMLLWDLIAARTAGHRIHSPPPDRGVPPHLVAYAPLSLLPNWGVTAEQPQDVVLAVPHQLQQRLALFGFLALLLAAAVAWLDVRRVVRPLKHLTAAAERFAAGQLDEPVHLGRADELGILANAFETMRERLRTSLAEVAEWNRELERRVAARTAEVEARNRELAHLNAIAETVTRSLDVKPMLEHTLERVLQITGAEVGCFWVNDGAGAKPTLIAARGLPADPEAGWLWSDGSPCSRAALLGEPIVADETALAEGGAVCDALGLKSCLTVPLPAGAGVQGMLFLASGHPQHHFEQRDVATLSAIGRQVGMALANARLYQSLRARERERAELLQRIIAAQEEERRRLAQELHDETSQALVSLQLGLERLAGGAEEPEQVRPLAAQLQSVAAETLVAVHRLAVELRPSILDDIGMVAAIERYLHECGRQWELVVDLAAVGVENLRLIPPAETAIYRIVQAALTNIVRHAKAQCVSVLLERRRDDRLMVIVEDDGRGFDLGAVRAAPLQKRLGLAGMEERAALIGATLTIETSPGAGTTVFLDVPIGLNAPGETVGVEAADRAR